MKRGKPLQRKPFKRPELPPRVNTVHVPRSEPARATLRAPTRFTEPILKAVRVESEPYRKLVASLPCWRCGIHGYTQACHGDYDKGMQLKTCDLTCWPGCGPHDGIEGCHEFVGRRMPRQERRSFEARAAADTQATLIALAGNDKKVRRVLVAVGLVKG